MSSPNNSYESNSKNDNNESKKTKEIVDTKTLHTKYLQFVLYKKDEPLAGYSEYIKTKDILKIENKELTLISENSIESDKSVSSVSDDNFYEVEDKEYNIKDEKLSIKDELPIILNLDKTIEEFKRAKEYKFIYLIYAFNKTSKYFSPYSFITGPFKSIDKDCFFTLSNRGMTSNIQNGGCFTPLTTFEENYRCHKILVQLSFFKNYLKYKYLHFWYKHISQKKFSCAREELQLILFKNPLISTSLKIIDIIYQNIDVNIYDRTITEENNLQGFKEQQEKSTKAAIEILKNLRKTIKVLIFNACVDALKESGFTVDDNNFLNPKWTEYSKNIKYTMLYVEKSAKLEHCQRICRYIMWIDFILQTHLHKNIRNQISIFKNDVGRNFKYIPIDNLLNDSDVQTTLEGERSSDDPKLPLFTLEVLLTKTGIEPSTTQNDFNSYISFLMEHWKWNMITYMPPILNDYEFDAFAEPTICGKTNARICGNGPSLKFVFDNDDVYKSTADEILNYFNTNYNAVSKYLKRLEYVYIIYRDNENLDRETIIKETDIIKFREMLVKYKQQQNDVDKIVSTQMLGIFYLKLQSLKNVVKSNCEHLLELVEKTMVKVGKHLINELSNEINDSLKYLLSSPSTAAQYVDYKNFLGKSIEMLNEMDINLNYITELYDLADEFDVPIPDEDTEHFYECSDLFNSLQKTFKQINNEQVNKQITIDQASSEAL